MIYEIRIYGAAAAVKAASETDGPFLKSQIVSMLSPAIAGLPPG